MNMKKRFLNAVLLTLIAIHFPLYTAAEANNLVHSPQMATDLTEIYVRNVYGEDAANSQKPYVVKETPSEYILEGTLPPEFAGGVFMVIIAKKDGRVVKITHGK